MRRQMTKKVQRLQRGLIAGTVLLLTVLAGTLSYSRWRAAKGWLGQVKRRSGASLERETDGFTYSQSLQGRTVFTLHAAKAFQHADGLYTLHDVVLTLYGLRGDRADRVYGKDFEWDDTKGIARADGEVHMDLQVPAAAAMAARSGGQGQQAAETADRESIHVKTSGVVFLRKLDVAATEQPIEFHYGDLTCVARGAELDNNPSALHLLADVKLNGLAHGKPVGLTAVKADFERAGNLLTLMQPVMRSEDQKASAAQAVLHLRGDGSVDSAQAVGNVELVDGTRRVSGARLDAVLTDRSQLVSAKMSGGVRLVDTDRDQPAQGQAAELRVKFDGKGQAQEVTAAGKAELSQRQRSAAGVWLEREARGEQIVATLAAGEKGQSRLKQVHAAGGAEVRGQSAGRGNGAAEVDETTATADDLTVEFAESGGKSLRPVALHGRGHARLGQSGASGLERVTSGDALDVTFAPSRVPGRGSGLEVASATESGHVAIRSVTPPPTGAAKKTPEVATGSADRAAFDGAGQKLTLTGNARAVNADASLAADSIVVNQATGDAEATGNVTGTLSGSQAGKAGTGPVTHLAAHHGVLVNATHTATFDGGGKPVRIWQDASQVEADVIVLDNAKRTLVARPLGAGGVVHSVFAGESGGKASGGKKAQGVQANVLTVESRTLTYSDAQKAATFEGPVRVEGPTGAVRGGRAVASFAPADGQRKGAEGISLPGNTLDRVVVTGGVRMQQPGRFGTGEQLVYKAADGSFLLTGSASAAPQVVDERQGTVTGTSLMFRGGDSTIVVAGAAQGTPGRTRARIETHVR